MAQAHVGGRVVGGRYVAAVYFVSACLYVVSCLLPATDIGGDFGPYLGLFHLLFGWVSGLKGLPAWSSNFVLWAGLVCLLLSRFRMAAVLGVTAALLGLTTLTSFKSDGMHAGYYVWQTSQFVFAGGALTACWMQRSSSPSTNRAGA